MPSRKNVSVYFLLFLLIPILSVSKVSGATATVAVDPPVSNVTIGDTFNVNINVSNIANFTCFELKLYFLNGVLNCTAVTQGPFLQTAGGTFYNKTIVNNFDATHGQLWAYSTLLGSTSANGSGTILTVTFKAVGGGDTLLHLADIKLGDEKIPPWPIPYTATDGIVHSSGAGPPHDVTVTDIKSSKTVIGQGYKGNITVTAENHGSFTETFNLTAYANTTVISTLINVTLASGNSTTVTYTWDTTGFALGNYTISAYAWPLTGEANMTNNNCTDGLVHVGVPGNVNYFDSRSRMVDMIDLWLIQGKFGGIIGDPRYVPNYDVDNGGKIDMIDLWITQKHFGQIEP